LLDHVLCNWIGSYWNDQASGLRISGSGSRTQTFC
jgi:hypothetical protein